jgi:homoserine dehydrogenase
MELGESFESAVAYTQKIGIGETDPSGDIDGWDAAVKVAALVTVLMGIPLKPQDVNRIGIRNISLEDVLSAKSNNQRYKLVCSANCTNHMVQARVAPELISSESPLLEVDGTTSLITFETDVLGPLTLIEENPGPQTTAYGLLADFINAVT